MNTVIRLAVAVAVSLVVTPNSCGQSESDHLRALAAGYLANRDSFDQFSCEFVVRMGQASSFEKAVSGGPATEVVEADVLWLKDGDFERHEVLREVTLERAEKEKSGGFGVMLPPAKRLDTDELQLSYSGVLKGGTLHSDKVPAPPIQMTPLDLCDEMGSDGELNPGDMARKWLGAADSPVEFEYGGQNAGLEKFQLVFREEDGEVRLSYGLDPSRGFLPIQTTLAVGDAVSKRILITDTIECPSNRWFPKRIVSVRVPEGAGEHFVSELVVKKLTLGPPPRDQFRITLPENVVIHNGERNSQIRLTRQQSFHADDLDELMKGTTEARIEREAAERVRARPGVAVRILVLGSVAIVVVVGAFYLFRRGRRATRK